MLPELPGRLVGVFLRAVVVRPLGRNGGAPPERGSGAGPRHVFALGLAEQAIGLAGEARQPRHIGLGVVPRDVDDRLRAAAHFATNGQSVRPRWATQASQSSTVTGNLPIADTFEIVTSCCGPSSLPRCGSRSTDPMRNDPVGTITMTGHPAPQSLNERSTGTGPLGRAGL